MAVAGGAAGKGRAGKGADAGTVDAVVVGHQNSGHSVSLPIRSASATSSDDTGPVSTDVEGRLLEVLRRKTESPELRYATPPLPVTGGFWADILAVRLTGAPPDLDRDLIVRIVPTVEAAQREAIVQSEVVAQGFPAPPVRLTGMAQDGRGRPFIVMDRMPGRPPLPEIGGPAALAGIGRAAIKLPDLLARTAARLHALDPAPLRRPPDEPGVAG